MIVSNDLDAYCNQIYVKACQFKKNNHVNLSGNKDNKKITLRAFALGAPNQIDFFMISA